MWYIDTDNVISIVGLRNVVSLAYVNDATITGVLYDLPALSPNVAAAVDKSDGKVGIPCTGHGKSSGDSIRIERSINYNSDYMLETGTTVDELVITATFAAETFTGNEFIYTNAYGTKDAPITFEYTAESDGNYSGKIPYSAPLLQGEEYVLCIKEISGQEQVLAKVIQRAGFQGM